MQATVEIQNYIDNIRSYIDRIDKAVKAQFNLDLAGDPENINRLDVLGAMGNSMLGLELYCQQLEALLSAAERSTNANSKTLAR